MYHIN